GGGRRGGRGGGSCRRVPGQDREGCWGRGVTWCELGGGPLGRRGWSTVAGWYPDGGDQCSAGVADGLHRLMGPGVLHHDGPRGAAGFEQDCDVVDVGGVDRGLVGAVGAGSGGLRW